MNPERRAPRFQELDRLIALGQGSVRRNRKTIQSVECVSCHGEFPRCLEEIDPNEPQYCRRCRGELSAGMLKREANLVLGGRPRRPDYKPPELRRRIYLRAKGVREEARA